MKIKQLEKELKTLKDLPVDRNFLTLNKDQLLETIYNDPLVQVKEEMGRKNLSFFNMRAFKLKAVPAFLVIIALLLSTGTAYASQDSLPNDMLYPVKLLTEKVEQTLTFDKVKKTEIAFKHAQRRIDELSMVEPKEITNKKVLTKTLDNYENNINLGIEYIKKMNETETTLIPINKYDRELTEGRKNIKELSEIMNYQEINEFKAVDSILQKKQSEYLNIILNKANEFGDLIPQLETLANDRIIIWEEELRALPNNTIIIEPENINLKEDAQEKITILRARIQNEVKEMIPVLQKELTTWSANLNKIPTSSHLENIESRTTETNTTNTTNPETTTANTQDSAKNQATDDGQRQEATSPDITPEQQAFKNQIMELIKQGDIDGAMNLINSNPDVNESMPSDFTDMLQ